MFIPEEPLSVLKRLQAAGYESCAVGGCVRDSLRGIDPHDWDICTAALPSETEAVFAGEEGRDGAGGDGGLLDAAARGQGSERDGDHCKNNAEMTFFHGSKDKNIHVKKLPLPP